MAKIWVMLKRKQKIWRDVVIEVAADDSDCAHEAVGDACHELDIPRPLWFEKNEKDMQSFGRTFFAQDHFMEHIEFDRMEVEFLREKSKSRDPRNDFSY